MDSSIPFYVPWINEEDRRAVSNSLKSRWLTGGPQAKNFENKFAQYVGTKFAVSVNSCTAALHLAMRVIGVGPGDEVIVPDFTFAATANAPIFCGATPVFADIDEKTFNISSNDILERITPKTKAIIPVHYGGQPCEMKEISELADDYNLSVVEDCAHSLGAKYRSKQTGSFGIMGCFSFYPTKIITTLEGGMITTNDGKIARKLQLLREHGMSHTALERESSSSWSYDIVELGYNYRLTEPQAALGISQLKRVDNGIKRRIDIASCYTKQLCNCDADIATPYMASHRSHIFHLYTVKVQKPPIGRTRDTVFNKLSASGIQSSVHYTPLHLMTFYKQFLTKKSSQFPITEKIYNEILSLPIYPTLTREQIVFVSTKIREVLNK